MEWVRLHSESGEGVSQADSSPVGMLPYLDKMCNELHRISFAPCNTGHHRMALTISHLPRAMDIEIDWRLTNLHQLCPLCN